MGLDIKSLLSQPIKGSYIKLNNSSENYQPLEEHFWRLKIDMQ